MAVRTVKARVELDGEKEYKQALSELNSGNKTLASEMRKLKSEYQGNSDSVEFLTKKGELLERQLLQQKDKVETLRKAVKAAADEYGESDERTQKWVQQLNNAEAAEFDLTHAIEKNDKALKGEDAEMLSLGDTVEQLAKKLGIQIPEGAKKALNGIQGFSAGTVAKMAVAAASVAAVVKVVKELGDLTLQVASEVDNYLSQSAITNVSTDLLQAWDYAAPLIDTDAETIKGAMNKITKAMGDARDGSETAMEKFSELGVSITDADGNLRNSVDVFYDVVDALGEIDNATERDAAAMELMGKSAQDLNPLINAGSEALKGYAEEAEAVGYILSKDQVKALGDVDDAYQKLQLTIDGVKKQIAADFAPAAQKAMELFSDAVQKAGEFLERSGLIKNLASILSSAMSLVETVGQMISNLPGLGTALDGINIVLKATATIMATIADAANLVAGVLTGNWDQVKTALGKNVANGQLSNLKRLEFSGSEYAGWVYDERVGAWVSNGYNASGNDNWRGGLTWVGESGPELVALPAGSQILNAQDSENIGGNVYIEQVVIDASSINELNDIVELFRDARVRQRMR